MTASVPRAAAVPHTGERQPRVLPTASTIVNASTHSTTLARNAGTAAMIRVNAAAVIAGLLLIGQLAQCYSCYIIGCSTERVNGRQAYQAANQKLRCA